MLPLAHRRPFPTHRRHDLERNGVERVHPEVCRHDRADQRRELLRDLDRLSHRAALVYEERGRSLDLGLLRHAPVHHLRERLLRLLSEVRRLHRALRLHRGDALVRSCRLQLVVDERLDLGVVHGAPALEHPQVVDHLLRRHRINERDEQRRGDVSERADRGRVRDLPIQDDLRLLLRALRLSQPLEHGERAVLGWRPVEQARLRPLTRLDPQRRVQVLEVLARPERRPIELSGVALARAEVVGDGAPEHARALADHSLGVVYDARDLKRRESLQQRPARLAELRVLASEQVSGEQHLVVAHLPALEVPGREVRVEERVALQRLGVQRRELLELAVRRRQEGVEDLHPHIAFCVHRAVRHYVSPVAGTSPVVSARTPAKVCATKKPPRGPGGDAPCESKVLFALSGGCSQSMDGVGFEPTARHLRARALPVCKHKRSEHGASACRVKRGARVERAVLLLCQLSYRPTRGGRDSNPRPSG